jgi:hypothetical protein
VVAPVAQTDENNVLEAAVSFQDFVSDADERPPHPCFVENVGPSYHGFKKKDPGMSKPESSLSRRCACRTHFSLSNLSD